MQDPNDKKKSYYDLALEASEGMGDVERSAFMAQIRHETGDFNWNRELINRDGSFTPAQQGYGGGTAYTGRGLIQLTHKENYEAYETWAGLEPGTITNNPSVMSEDEEHQKAAARWFWDTRVKPNITDFSNTKKITRLINGGYNGLEERQRYFAEYNTPEIQGEWEAFLNPKKIQQEETIQGGGLEGAARAAEQAAGLGEEPTPTKWYGYKQDENGVWRVDDSAPSLKIEEPRPIYQPQLGSTGTRDISELTFEETMPAFFQGASFGYGSRGSDVEQKEIDPMEFNERSRSILFMGNRDFEDFEKIPHEVRKMRRPLVEGKGKLDRIFGLTQKEEAASYLYDDLGIMHPGSVEHFIDELVQGTLPQAHHDSIEYGTKAKVEAELSLAITAAAFIEARKATGHDVTTPYYNLNERGLPTDPELLKLIEENTYDVYNDIAYGFTARNAVENDRIFAPGSNLDKIYDDMVYLNDVGTTHENLVGMTPEEYDALPWWSLAKAGHKVLSFGGAATRRTMAGLGINVQQKMRVEAGAAALIGEGSVYAAAGVVTGGIGRIRGWSKAKNIVMSTLAGIATDRMVSRRGEGDLHNLIGHYWGDSAYAQTIGKHFAITAEDTAKEATDKEVQEGIYIALGVEAVGAVLPPMFKGLLRGAKAVKRGAKAVKNINFRDMYSAEKMRDMFGKNADEVVDLVDDMDPLDPPDRLIEIIDEMDEPNIEITEMHGGFGIPSVKGIQDFWDSMVSNLEDIHKRRNPGGETPDNIFKFYAGLHPDMFGDAFKRFKDLTKDLGELNPSDMLGRERILKQIDETVESMAGTAPEMSELRTLGLFEETRKVAHADTDPANQALYEEHIETLYDSGLITPGQAQILDLAAVGSDYKFIEGHTVTPIDNLRKKVEDYLGKETASGRLMGSTFGSELSPKVGKDIFLDQGILREAIESGNEPAVGLFVYAHELGHAVTRSSTGAFNAPSSFIQQPLHAIYATLKEDLGQEGLEGFVRDYLGVTHEGSIKYLASNADEFAAAAFTHAILNKGAKVAESHGIIEAVRQIWSQFVAKILAMFKSGEKSQVQADALKTIYVINDLLMGIEPTRGKAKTTATRLLEMIRLKGAPAFDSADPFATDYEKPDVGFAKAAKTKMKAPGEMGEMIDLGLLGEVFRSKPRRPKRTRDIITDELLEPEDIRYMHAGIPINDLIEELANLKGIKAIRDFAKKHGFTSKGSQTEILRGKVHEELVMSKQEFEEDYAWMDAAMVAEHNKAVEGKSNLKEDLENTTAKEEAEIADTKFFDDQEGLFETSADKTILYKKVKAWLGNHLGSIRFARRIKEEGGNMAPQELEKLKAHQRAMFSKAKRQRVSIYQESEQTLDVMDMPLKGDGSIQRWLEGNGFDAKLPENERLAIEDKVNERDRILEAQKESGEDKIAEKIKEGKDLTDAEVALLESTEIARIQTELDAANKRIEELSLRSREVEDDDWMMAIEDDLRAEVSKLESIIGGYEGMARVGDRYRDLPIRDRILSLESDINTMSKSGAASKEEIDLLTEEIATMKGKLGEIEGAKLDPYLDLPPNVVKHIDKTLEKVQEFGVDVIEEINELIRLSNEYDEAVAKTDPYGDTGAEPGTLADVFSKEDLSADRNMLENRREDLHQRLTRLTNLQPGMYYELAESNTIIDLVNFLRESAEEARTASDNFDARIAMYEQATSTAESKVVELQGEIRVLKKELKDGGAIEGDVLDSTGELIPKPKWAAKLQAEIEKLEKKNARLVAAAEKSSAKKAEKAEKKAAKLNKRFEKLESKAEEIHKEGVKARRKARTAEATVEKNEKKIEKLEREALSLESASLLRHQRDVLKQVRKFRKWLDNVPSDIADGILEAARTTRELTKTELKALKDGGITSIYNDLRGSGALELDDEGVYALLQQLEELDKELKALRKQKKAEAGIDVKAAEKKVKAKTKTIQELEDELTALRELSPEEAADAAKLVEDLESGLAIAKQELAELQKTFDETPIGKLRKARADYKAAWAEKTRTSQKIEDVKDVELTVDEAAEAAEVNAKINKLREQNSLLRKEWKQTDQGRLETSGRKAKQLEKKAAKLREEIEEGAEVDVIDELENARTRVKALEKDLELLEGDAAATVNVAINRISRDLDEVERLQEFIDSKTGKIDPMREALGELQEAYEQHRNRPSDLQREYNLVRAWLKMQKLRAVGVDTNKARMMQTVQVPGSDDMAKLESMMAQNERRNGMNGKELSNILRDFSSFGKGWGSAGTSKALMSWLDMHPIVGVVSPSRPRNFLAAKSGGRTKATRGAAQSLYNYLKSSAITALVSGESTLKLALGTGTAAQVSRMLIREMLIKRGFAWAARGDFARVLEVEKKVRAMQPLPKRKRPERRGIIETIATPSRPSKNVVVPDDGETKTGWGVDVSEGKLKHLGKEIAGDDLTPGSWEVFMIENDVIREVLGVWQGITESVSREGMAGLIDENLIKVGMDKVTLEYLISESVDRGMVSTPEAIYQRMVALIELDNGVVDGSIKIMDGRKWLGERLGVPQKEAEFLISVHDRAKNHQRRATLTNRVPTKLRWLQMLSRIPGVDIIALFMKTRANTATLAVEMIPGFGVAFRSWRGLNETPFDKTTTLEMQLFGWAVVAGGITLSNMVDDEIVEIDKYGKVWFYGLASATDIEKEVRRVLSVDPTYFRRSMEGFNEYQDEVFGDAPAAASTYVNVKRYDPDNPEDVERYIQEQIMGESIMKDGRAMVRKEVSPIGHLGSAMVTGIITDRLIKGAPMDRRDETSTGKQILGAYYSSVMNVFGIGSVFDIFETLDRVVKDPTNVTAIAQVFIGNAISPLKQLMTSSQGVLSYMGESYEGRFNRKEHLGFVDTLMSNVYWSENLDEGRGDWTGMPMTRAQRTHFGSTNMEVLLTPHEIVAHKFAITIEPQNPKTVLGFTGIDLYEFNHTDSGHSAYRTLNMRTSSINSNEDDFASRRLNQQLHNYYKGAEFTSALAVAEDYNSLRHQDPDNPVHRGRLIAYRRKGDQVKTRLTAIRGAYWDAASWEFRNSGDTDNYVNADGVTLTEQLAINAASKAAATTYEAEVKKKTDQEVLDQVGGK